MLSIVASDVVRILAGAAALILAAAPGQAAPLTADEVDRAFSAIGATDPGCAVGVVENGQLVLARGYGVADVGTRQPLTAETPLDIASLTKQFTAGAVALLIEEGRLREEDEIHRFFPSMPSYGAPITVGDLLRHSSGLRDYLSLADFAPGKADMSNDRALALVIRQRGLNFTPGTEYLYSNSNYLLLAKIVENVSGQPLGVFLADRFFRPLGMGRTRFLSPETAPGYVRDGSGWTPGGRLSSTIGAGNLTSTVADLALWVDNLATGRVGGAAWLRRMRTTRPLAGGAPGTYGYGLGVYPDWLGIDGITMLNHSGSSRGYNSSLYALPELRFGLIQLCNASSAPMGAAGALTRARLAARTASPNAAAAAAPPAFTDTPAPRIAGWWLNPATDRVLHLVAQDDGVALDTGRRPLPLTRTGPAEWNAGGMVTFALEDGERTLRERMQGPAPARYERREAATAARLGDYVGSYRSAEVDGELVLIERDGALVARQADNEVALLPTFQDAFSNPAAGYVNLTFERRGDGSVAALKLTTPSGLRRFRLERAPASGDGPNSSAR